MMSVSIPLLKNIQQMAWKIQFRRELAHTHRHQRFTSLAKAEYVGLLFDASSESNYRIVYDFARNLIDQQKRIKALGFVNGTAIPHYCHPLLSFDFFTLKDLNWYKKPVSPFVRDFIALDFDIAINLDTGNTKYLNYVMGLSQAHFKVGKYHPENTAYYDLLIDVNDGGQLDLLLGEITRYLAMLKPSTAANTS